MHKKLAELIGIILGDGNLNKKSNCITIVGSLEEFDYYTNHVIPLIDSLFKGINVKLRQRKDRNAYYIDFCSKKVMEFFVNEIGLIRGNKKDAHVPTIIKRNIELIPHFLRGVFDTDGCLKFSKQNKSKNYYPRIQFCFRDTPFANEVKVLLEKMNFNLGIWKDFRFKNNLIFYQISGGKNLERWMKIIGSNNSVHKTKYLVWEEQGFYTPKSSLMSRMNTLNLNTEL